MIAKISDQEIILSIRQADPTGWEHIFNKYGGLMLGTVLHSTNNKDIAEDILFQIFCHLKTIGNLGEPGKPLVLKLILYTARMTRKILKNTSTPVARNPLKNTFPIFSSLLFQQCTPKAVAELLSITVKGLRERLHLEFNQIRKLNISTKL